MVRTGGRRLIPAGGDHQHAREGAQLVVDRGADLFIPLEREPILLEAAITPCHVADPFMKARTPARFDEFK